MEDASSKKHVRPTGIAEFDEILSGGLPTNATVFLSGPPGSGKTILASQWLFNGFQKYGESGIYFSLTEPTTKLLSNLRKMSFFSDESVSTSDLRVSRKSKAPYKMLKRAGLHFMDLRIMMEDLGLEKKDFTRADIDRFSQRIVDIVNESNAKRVVIDSVSALAYRLNTEEMMRTFIFRLGTFLGLMDANVLLIGEGGKNNSAQYGVEGFISDGVIRLDYGRRANEMQRTLEIVKMRGLSYDSHVTSFRVGENGIKLYPRLRRELTSAISSERASTGVNGLDEMTQGGYLEGSTVVIMGPSGTGKSITCLHFLMAGLSKGEAGLLVSFEESREQILQIATTFGWDLTQYEKSGLLKFINADVQERYFDENIKLITETVKLNGIKRVVIDSLSAVGNDYGPESLREFSSQLMTGLKSQGTTTLFTLATEGFMGTTTLSEAHISSFVDSIFLFRFVEIQSELRRALIVVKMRGSNHDKKLREVIINDSGMAIATDFSGYEGVLTGVSRKVKDTVGDQMRVLFLEVLGPMGEKIFLEAKQKGLDPQRVKTLIEQLGSQGIISLRRKEDFVARASAIFSAVE